MLISNKYKFIFIAVPKTASSAIHRALSISCNKPKPEWPEPFLHHRPLFRILIDHPEATDYFKFGYVRNPWDRTVSVWCDFHQHRTEGKYSGLVTAPQPLFSEFKDFKDFCMNVGSSPIWADDIFLQPQHKFLSPNIDFVGRFENLHADLQHICKTLNIYCRLHKNKHRQTKHPHYTEMYDEDSKRAIGKLYQSDIEKYNYEF